MSMRVFGAIALLFALGGVVAQNSPLIHDNTVTFVATGSPSDPPRIVGDFNGWQDGVMAPSEDGRTFTLRVTLDPAARIEYLIAYKNRFVRDPGNPRSVTAPAGPPRSELRMPAYRPPTALPPARAKGTIARIPFIGRSGVHRQIRVYVPSSANDVPHPILYAHDGDIMLDALGLSSILDSLIGAGRMAPVYVAFITAADRHDDYEPGSRFRSEFTAEMIPMLEGRYRVDANRRAVMGLSRSTVGAFDACANGPVRFESCALMAPAIPERQFGAVLAAPTTSMRVFIETGTYDIPLVTDARALRQALERRGLSVHFVESPEGHNRTAFRARLPAVMEQLFPAEPPVMQKGSR